MTDITLAAFLVDVGSITTVLMSTIADMLQIFMTPPLSIFVGAAILAVGIKYGIRIMHSSKKMA